MAEKVIRYQELKDKFSNNFETRTSYSNKWWYETEEVYSNDFERVINYLLDCREIGKISSIGFYPHLNVLRLSFLYNIKEPRPADISLRHARAFVCPPISLLKLLYEYAPAHVKDFIIRISKKYDVNELSNDDATWLMSIILGSCKLD